MFDKEITVYNSIFTGSTFQCIKKKADQLHLSYRQTIYEILETYTDENLLVCNAVVFQQIEDLRQNSKEEKAEKVKKNVEEYLLRRFVDPFDLLADEVHKIVREIYDLFCCSKFKKTLAALRNANYFMTYICKPRIDYDDTAEFQATSNLYENYCLRKFIINEPYSSLVRSKGYNLRDNLVEIVNECLFKTEKFRQRKILSIIWSNLYRLSQFLHSPTPVFFPLHDIITGKVRVNYQLMIFEEISRLLKLAEEHFPSEASQKYLEKALTIS